MLQLTYISTATAGTSETIVADILRASRLNNAAADVSGMLLYDGYRFLQALEGPPDAVNATFLRVKADTRHRAVVVLSSKQVEERSFGSWSMAAERVAVAEGMTLPQLVENMTATMTDRNTRALFRSFAQVRAAA